MRKKLTDKTEITPPQYNRAPFLLQPALFILKQKTAFFNKKDLFIK